MTRKDLKKMIMECIDSSLQREEFGEEGTMQAVNIRENNNIETKDVGAFGAADFFGTEPRLVSLLNNTNIPLKITVKKMGEHGTFYIQIDK